jgi:hypothetical protein
MQSGMANPQLMQRLMQMRQDMGGGINNMPQGNPMQASQMLNNQQPMGMGNQPGMTMGQPSPQIMQQLLQRRRMMMQQQQPGVSTMGVPNPQPGMSRIDNGGMQM